MVTVDLLIRSYLFCGLKLQVNIKGSAVRGAAESGGTIRRRTAGSRHLEDDACGQGAAGTGETLYETPCLGFIYLEKLRNLSN